MPKYYLIIPATGVGSRMNSNIPKQYLKLDNGLTLLDKTLETLLNINYIEKVVLAFNEVDTFFKDSKFAKHPKLLPSVIGGKERYHSVFNALLSLEKIASDDDFILVHDSIRPLIKKNDVINLIEQLKDDKVGGLLAIKIVDTLKKTNKDTIETIDRTNLYGAQTPQMYRFKYLKKALQQTIDNNITITDETQAIEQLNLKPKIIIGSKENIKITYPEDLALANFFLYDTTKNKSDKKMRIKTGLGQDSHRFESTKTTKKLKLGGIVFEGKTALEGNSDADVVLHSITNAISSITGKNVLGKVADELCKSGITDSSIYLKHALDELQKISWKIEHISISIECKLPQISPKIEAMKNNICKLTNIKNSDIGITATTGENLTDFGKGKGIQVFSIITVSNA
jgi:2-C-methyl-D-erythritol 4-phosphate cytidylyltransferase